MISSFKNIFSILHVKRISLVLASLFLFVSGTVSASTKPVEDFGKEMKQAFYFSAYYTDNRYQFDLAENHLESAIKSYLEGTVDVDAATIPNKFSEILGVDHTSVKYASQSNRLGQLQGQLQVAAPYLAQINKTFIETKAAVRFASNCKAGDSVIGPLQVYAANTCQLRVKIINQISGMLTKMVASRVFCHSLWDDDIKDAQKNSETLAEHASAGQGWYQASLETAIVMMEGGGAVQRAEADRQAKDYIAKCAEQIKSESYNNVASFKESLEDAYNHNYVNSIFKERIKSNVYTLKHHDYIRSKSYKKSSSGYGSYGYGSGSSYGSGWGGYKSSGSGYYGSGSKAEDSYTKPKGSASYGMPEAAYVENVRLKLVASDKKAVLAANYWAEVVKGDNKYGYLLRVVKYQVGSSVGYKDQLYIHPDKVGSVALNAGDIIGFNKTPRVKKIDTYYGEMRFILSVIR